MSPRFPVFETVVQEAGEWLQEISDEMGNPDPQLAYHALRGALFALRDRLHPDEAIDLAAQLPLLIRGIYFEGYGSIHRLPFKANRTEYLERINDELDLAGGADAETAARAVYRVLNRHISIGQIDQVRGMLPADLQDLWERLAA